MYARDSRGRQGSRKSIANADPNSPVSIAVPRHQSNAERQAAKVARFADDGKSISQKHSQASEARGKSFIEANSTRGRSRIGGDDESGAKKRSKSRGPKRGSGPKRRVEREGSAVSVASRRSERSRGNSSGRSNQKKLNGKVFALSMELIEHVSKGKLELAAKKIEQGASPDYADYDKRTPLHLAASEGHVDVVKMLLEKGANPDVSDRWGSRPYDDAVKNGYTNIGEILREYHEEDQEDTLGKEHHDGLELLEYCAMGLESLVREKIAAGTKAHFADYDKRTPLHLASCEGHEAIVELLLRNGAEATFKDRFGHTAVDDAMMNGFLEVLEVMRDAGVEIPPHIFDKSFTPEFEQNMLLIDVCAKGNVGKAQKLLKEGADAAFVDYDLRSPLHLACAEGHVNVVKLLLAAGADAAVEDRWKATPFDEAIKNGHTEVVRVLEDVTSTSTSSPVQSIA